MNAPGFLPTLGGNDAAGVQVLTPDHCSPLRWVVPLVLLSIPMAVGIHTVTAFLYNGLAARPYWNSSILAPQFLASAFCSGPAILLIVLQVLRRFTAFEIRDQAIWKIAELMAYAMFLNLFLHGAEAFKEYYSNTEHLLYTRYWYQGLGAHRTLLPYAWSAVALNVSAFLLFIVPAGRRFRCSGILEKSTSWHLRLGVQKRLSSIPVTRSSG